MTLLNILQFPDPRLKLVASPVSIIDDNIKNIVQNMLETMYNAKNGVGLAAIQVNIQKRIIVMDLSEEKNSPQIIINPRIVKKSTDTFYWEEGCLSFPGISTKVKRSKHLQVEFLDLDGEKKTIDAQEPLLSVCLQHEIDHLDGITFFDHLSKIKQKILANKIKKNKD